MAPVSDRIIKSCARSIVETCNLRKGDAVIVRGGAHSMRLLEDISLECFKAGAIPGILMTSDRLSSRTFKEVPAKTLETVPKHFVEMLRASDMYIGVETLDDPEIAAKFPRDKLEALHKAHLPVLDLMSGKKDSKKWLYAGWPTKAAARSYGIPYAELERIVLGGMSVRPSILMKIGKNLDRRFRDASWVHAWDDRGTDLRVKVEGRRRNIDDGFISDEDYKANDRGGNLPAGELFFATHENTGEGTLFCPITRDVVSDKFVTNVKIEFRKGRILLDRVRADKNAGALVQSFKECESVDKTKYKPVRTRNLAELGIGFNPRIKKPIGYILTDEKVCGTIHIAFGSNLGYGGTSESIMHWDFVSAPGINLDVERTDGSTASVMRKGKLV